MIPACLLLTHLLAFADPAAETPDASVPPLHERIDALIEAEIDGPIAPPATDGEFLRRASLDLNGLIPTAEEARAFLDDPSPYKREGLIEDLLERPRFARHLAAVLDVMFMERRRDQHVPRKDWERFLLNAVAENRPFDELVREILSADGSERGRKRAPAKFLLERELEPHLLTRDIGRIFLGRDMQCAQCHDHPLVDQYKQADYYGIFAFVNRASLFTDPASKIAMVAEKADGDVTFESVFVEGDSHSTGPRLLDQAPIEEPTIPEEAAYVVAPEKDVRAVPAYSRLERLAPALTAGDLEEFDRNIVNRLWAMVMKYGLVEPVDMHHPDNPPTHPELLDLLAESFRSMDYNMKAFLAELVKTRAYARSSEPPPGSSAATTDPWVYAVANVEPMTPEQLGWSVLRGLGVYDNVERSVERRIDQVDTKLRDLLETDEARRQRRAWIVEAEVASRLKGNVNRFIRLFGAGEGQPGGSSDPSVQQALFLSNNGLIQNWLKPSGDNLTGRLAEQPTDDLAAEELYLSLLTRRPTPEERAEVAAYLEGRDGDRDQALRELAWAVLTCAEFRFNH